MPHSELLVRRAARDEIADIEAVGVAAFAEYRSEVSASDMGLGDGGDGVRIIAYRLDFV